MNEYYSNGKLLFTAEYAILDGAKGLALPTKYGQSLIVKKSHNGQINWQSYDDKNSLWFGADLDLKNFTILNTSDFQIADQLVQILKVAKELNPDFLNEEEGIYIDTQLTFPKNWGLGTSSTLINNLGQWAKVDPFLLLEKTFGGSGYDIACAYTNKPIIYHRKNSAPKIEKTDFNPSFKDQLFFIYLNKKKNSREAIKTYRGLSHSKEELIKKVNHLTEAMISSKELQDFRQVIEEHEDLISKTLNIPTIKEQIFNDYPGSVKSLGAWGGDFILATGPKEDWGYFEDKGFSTILTYSQMIL